MTLTLQRTDVEVESTAKGPVHGARMLRMTHTVRTSSAEAIMLEPLLMSPKQAEGLIEALRLAIVRARTVPSTPSINDATSSRST